MYLLKNLEHEKLTGQIIKKAINEEIEFYLYNWVKIDSMFDIKKETFEEV